ncbi:MAG: hypothetical protein IBX57_00005 [Gammaproteobacteria bacterium]|nr:hypothetical protein [Gammaproteobacteria bacterium]
MSLLKVVAVVGGAVVASVAVGGYTAWRKYKRDEKKVLDMKGEMEEFMNRSHAEFKSDAIKDK